MKRSWMMVLLVLGWTTGMMVRADESLQTDFIENYATIVLASYEDSLTTAQTMQTAIDLLIADPTTDNLQAAKDAWLAARLPYGQTEVYRFYGGPIDGEDGPEAYINSWPMDEVYIDYVEGAPDAGIINDAVTYPDIDATLLESLNQKGAEENVATGYHAIEFLLWGQDLSDDGPGMRPYTDYTTAPNAERRAAYLKTVTDLLVSQLETLVQAWSDTPDSYRQQFLALPPQEALTLIVTGVGSLAGSELPGERMYTAYDNQDQEDEHSCFSDNTHTDIEMNFRGIENVFDGRYTRVDGTVISGAGLRDVIAAADADKAEQMAELITEAHTAIAEIHTPFDQAIVQSEYRPQVLTATDLVFDLGDLVSEVAALLDLNI